MLLRFWRKQKIAKNKIKSWQAVVFFFIILTTFLYFMVKVQSIILISNKRNRKIKNIQIKEICKS
jgi:hypothetical protein